MSSDPVKLLIRAANDAYTQALAIKDELGELRKELQARDHLESQMRIALRRGAAVIRRLGKSANWPALEFLVKTMEELGDERHSRGGPEGP